MQIYMNQCIQQLRVINPNIDFKTIDVIQMMMSISISSGISSLETNGRARPGVELELSNPTNIFRMFYHCKCKHLVITDIFLCPDGVNPICFLYIYGPETPDGVGFNRPSSTVYQSSSRGLLLFCRLLAVRL